MGKKTLKSLLKAEAMGPEFFGGAKKVAYYSNGETTNVWPADHTPAEAQKEGYLYSFSAGLKKPNLAGITDV